MDAMVNGYLVSNILIDIGAKVNFLTLDAWNQMGRPSFHPSSNVLYMANEIRAMPIGVLKDDSITIQGSKFKADFK
ncbi:hypothetical protein KI387_023686, partial [Taxus chinensis]